MTRFNFEIIDLTGEMTSEEAHSSAVLCRELTEFLFERAENNIQAMQALCGATLCVIMQAPSSVQAEEGLDAMFKSIYATLRHANSSGNINWSDKRH